MAERRDCFSPQHHPVHPDRRPRNHRCSFPGPSSCGGCLISPSSLSSSAHFLPTFLPKCLSTCTPAVSYTRGGGDLNSACRDEDPHFTDEEPGLPELVRQQGVKVRPGDTGIVARGEDRASFVCVPLEWGTSAAGRGA